MWWWWCDDEVMMMWCVVSWKTLNTRRKNQDGALMFVTMFLYNYNYPTTTTGWGWTWTSSHQPPVHVQGWSRLNNQILLTSKIVNWTFTKRGKGSKSASNQNSFGAWCWLCAVTQWCLELIMCCDAVVLGADYVLWRSGLSPRRTALVLTVSIVQFKTN